MEFIIAAVILIVAVFVIAKYDNNQNVLNLVKGLVKMSGCLVGMGCLLVMAILILLITAGITLGISLM